MPYTVQPPPELEALRRRLFSARPVGWLRAGDMIMKDAGGISCSILYGQDNRSPITPQTAHTLYVAYAPPGVPAETVETQLRQIAENIRLLSPAAIVEQ